MSVHTVYRCDACPVPVDGECAYDHKVWLHLDRQMDGAGSMENVGQEVHLCHKCCILALREMTKVPHAVPYGEVRSDLFLKWIKARRKG